MPQPFHPWSAQEIRELRRALLRFFRERRRDLPWRDGPTPYGTLVSEIMLQQTRVETVVPYYRRWMERFPDPESLAEADEEEVLRLWQGLGYYSRARNLHRAVREVVERHGGELPGDPALLRELPGVGPYTAGAVASIAFHLPEPAVDGNVRRVLARLLDEEDPSPGALEAWARALVDPREPGDFNQALMELGATVCTPRTPECPACPVAARCQARARGTAEERPAPKRRGPLPRRDEAVAVVIREPERPRVLLRKRPPRGLLAGMWECPGAPLPPGESPETVAREVVRGLQEGGAPGGSGGAGGYAGTLGAPSRTPAAPPPDVPEWAAAPPEWAGPLSAVEHVFSHRRITYHPVLLPAPGTIPEGDALRWVPLDGLHQVALPVAQQRILAGAVAGLRGAGAKPSP